MTVNQRGTLDVNTCKGEQEQPTSTKEWAQTTFRGGDMRRRTQGSSEMNTPPRGYNTRYENRQYGNRRDPEETTGTNDRRSKLARRNEDHKRTRRVVKSKQSRGDDTSKAGSPRGTRNKSPSEG